MAMLWRCSYTGRTIYLDLYAIPPYKYRYSKATQDERWIISIKNYMFYRMDRIYLTTNAIGSIYTMRIIRIKFNLKENKQTIIIMIMIIQSLASIKSFLINSIKWQEVWSRDRIKYVTNFDLALHINRLAREREILSSFIRWNKRSIIKLRLSFVISSDWRNEKSAKSKIIYKKI